VAGSFLRRGFTEGAFVFCSECGENSAGTEALYSSYYFKNYQAYLLILNGFIELLNCMV
jgi:hypothetical protein